MFFKVYFNSCVDTVDETVHIYKIPNEKHKYEN